MIQPLMTRVRRRHLLTVLFGLAVAIFLVVKLVPSRGAPPIDIRSEGEDQRLARSVLASALGRLFPKGNGHWRAIYPADSETSSRCIIHRARYTSATGRALTATYVFAGWLEVRLADYVYRDAATAQRMSAVQPARHEEACYGQLLAEGLRRAGYVDVGTPRLFPRTSRSNQIEISSRYKGRRVNSYSDTTSVQRGRIILAVTTAVAEPFQKANEALARELATSLPSADSVSE
jgi:hypothetical protein